MKRSLAAPLLTVDLGAIAANSRFFADRAAGQLMAVVKADGFGHGAADVARTALANGASWFGVTSLDEALVLRAAGIRAPVLSWLNPVTADFDSALRQRVDIAIPTFKHLGAVAAAAVRTGQRARVHLHIDLGMARDGISSTSWPELCRQAHQVELRGQVLVAGVMGHLGWADDPSDLCNDLARRAFLNAVGVARRHGLRPRLRHLAATSATLTDSRTHLDLCRVGAGIVGIDPTSTTSLRPAMSLTAPVVSVRDVSRGTSVGYGHTYLTPRRTRLALLPVGYADGIPRAASGRAWVQIRGRRRQMVGLVSMDQIVIDVGEDGVEAGEVAVLFGPGDRGEPTVAEWATWARTIEHDIVTGIGFRVARRAVTTNIAAVRGQGVNSSSGGSTTLPRRGVGRLLALAAQQGDVA